MGHWGVKSYENDDAADALDAGFACVHGDFYDDLMDDGNPITPEQIQQKLANPETLAASIEAMTGEVGEHWDDEARLAFAGVVIRFVELGVAIPDEVRRRAVGYLKDEPIEWEEATARRLRRDKEIRLLSF